MERDGKKGGRRGERERGGGGERERERERETERQRDRETERETEYNKVQTGFVLETFYSKFSPLRTVSRPARSA